MLLSLECVQNDSKTLLNTLKFSSFLPSSLYSRVLFIGAGKHSLNVYCYLSDICILLDDIYTCLFCSLIIFFVEY